MDDCDGFFQDRGIPFDPDFQDEAVYEVWASDDVPYDEKKWLILCWFDVTYGEYSGRGYDLKDSRPQMSAFLTASKYATYEELLADPDYETHRTN